MMSDKDDHDLQKKEKNQMEKCGLTFSLPRCFFSKYFVFSVAVFNLKRRAAFSFFSKSMAPCASFNCSRKSLISFEALRLSARSFVTSSINLTFIFICTATNSSLTVDGFSGAKLILASGC